MLSVICALLVVPTAFAFSLLLWHNWKYRRVIAAARKLPTVAPTIPILGNLHQILRSSRDVAMPFVEMVERCKCSRNCVWVGPHPVFALTNSDDIQAVLSGSKTSKSRHYSHLKFIMGDGLITAPEHIHSITRRYINPLFKPRNLQNLIPSFNESSRHLVQSLSEHVSKGDVNMFKLTTKPVLSTISSLIFGTEIKTDMDSEEFKGLTKLGPSTGRVTIKRAVFPWLWYDGIANFLMKKEIEIVHKYWRQFVEGPMKIIEARTKQRDQQNSHNVNSQSSPTNGDSPNDLNLIDLFRVLQEKHPGFTEEHLHHEMITLFIAGEDTSRITISSCLLALADHTDIQERLFKEITSVMGSSTKDVTMQDLKDMPYLDQVLKETLRKFTVLPVIMRTAKEDIALRDFTIPAGATMFVNIAGLHYNPSKFPEPHKFDPERFTPERVANMKRFTYLPFSAGSRNCIGPLYAEMLVKTVVIHVLRRYHLTTNIDTRNLSFRMGMAMICNEGYNIQLHNRV